MRLQVRIPSGASNDFIFFWNMIDYLQCHLPSLMINGKKCYKKQYSTMKQLIRFCYKDKNDKKSTRDRNRVYWVEAERGIHYATT